VNPAPRFAVVTNPRSRARARLRARALAKLRESVQVVGELETHGDAGDGGRLAELVSATEPDVLVAAGGDGTARLALGALFETKSAERTALGFLPLGTGNNAARSLGLRALADGGAALALALAAIASGPRRAIDVGLVGGRPFLGSFAIGMDADVLALRMLEYVLAPAPVTLDVVDRPLPTFEVVRLVRERGYGAVCIADLPPGLPSRSRHLAKRLRAILPELRVLVGRWAPPALGDDTYEPLREAGVDHVGTTLSETADALAQLAAAATPPASEPVASTRERA